MWFLFVAYNASISDKNLKCTIHIIKNRLFLLFRTRSGESVLTNNPIPIASESDTDPPNDRQAISIGTIH